MPGNGDIVGFEICADDAVACTIEGARDAETFAHSYSCY